MLLAARDLRTRRTACSAILQELPAANVELLRLDLADLESVRHSSRPALDRDHGLDLLINNAGVMAVPQRQTTAQGFELQLGTNHLGHFALTDAAAGPAGPPGQPGGDGQQPQPLHGRHPTG